MVDKEFHLENYLLMKILQYMSEHDIQQFIDGQQSKNTIKKTLRDVDFVEKSFPFEKGREGHSLDSSK
jgi:hypothetical protein